jgi:simple sugar transport system ATP-binding protein
VQKVLVGREIAAAPTVLMAAYPVRGLDINSSYTIYNLLTEQKENGVAVVFVGEDLDVLLELCDRILVVCGGAVTGIVDGRTATKEQIGILMTAHPEQTEGTEAPDEKGGSDK